MAKRKKPKPGDILRYRSRPRRGGEILCHNHIMHLEYTPHGMNGFRWFTAKRGKDWKVCPCGWRPELGVHYAIPEHVAYHRKRIKAGKPMTVYWPFKPPPGFKRVGRNMIAARRRTRTLNEDFGR